MCEAASCNPLCRCRGLQPAQVVVNGNRFTPRGVVKQLKSYCHGGVLHSAALCSAIWQSQLRASVAVLVQSFCNRARMAKHAILLSRLRRGKLLEEIIHTYTHYTQTDKSRSWQKSGGISDLRQVTFDAAPGSTLAIGGLCTLALRSLGTPTAHERARSVILHQIL